MTSSLPSGLRERKKAKTRTAIREHAMRLFEEQGYAATTVDQIAAAADVSPSTFFRYFPTKEDVVLVDDFDPPLVAAMLAQPADLDPVEAVRRSVRAMTLELTEEQWAQERRRQRLIETVPELRTRSLQQFTDAITLLSGVIARRAGLSDDDFSSRVLAGAVIGAALAATRGSMSSARGVSYFDDFDRALVLMQAGFPLGPQAD